MSIENCSDSSWIEWNPQKLLDGDISVVLLILNQPFIPKIKKFLQHHWSNAILRVAADGGTRYIREASTSLFNLIPDIVCGDFDSADPADLEYYKEMGAQIIHTPDQDETDFNKALRICTETLTERHMHVDAVVVVARNGDRLDHILGNLNTLYAALKLSSIPVFILGDNTLTWLLKEGKHKIHVSKKMCNSHVGLIPLGEPCFDVTTTGLKWNLCHDHMEFGGLISTCNRFDGSEVTVESDKKLIWTMEVTLE